ncbi:MAG: hypothetical protein LBQ22_04500 [Bacteroidales bacterium]|jgi:hypothetical protein|nr:hypothetical protein [Bacteroidales bacterium]
MKIIPPYQISSEILNLINEANDFLIIVSPYVNFNNWDRIKIDIVNALRRNVNVNFYTRLDNENYKSWEQVENLGIIPKLVRNLHAKIYFNEKVGIVTSMNLLVSSNLNAIEFGAIYETEEELSELKKFVERFLEPNIEKGKPNEDDLYLAKESFKIVLTNYISNILNKRVSSFWENGYLRINANNQYYLGVDKARNTFSISGIISGREHDNFKVFANNTQLKDFVEIFLNHSSIEVVLNKKYSNSNLDFLLVEEKKEIIDIVSCFIVELSDFKQYCYENYKQM